MKTYLTIGMVSLLSVTIFVGFKKNENIVNTVDVGVIVSDLNNSLNFYTNVLGMEQTDTWHASKEMSTAYGVNNGKAFDIINLKLDCDGYILKYKLNNTPGNIPNNSIIDSTHENYSFEKLGTRYLTINVKNVDPFIERINKHNIKFKMVTLPNGYRVVLLYDPDGAILEIASN